MTINEYQEKAHSFAFYKGLEKKDFTYPALALAEEAGEVCGKFAKVVRDNNGILTDEKKIEIKKELGDVLWQVSELATLLDFKLEEVMQNNIIKLTDRKNRNVLKGSGDNR